MFFEHQKGDEVRYRFHPDATDCFDGVIQARIFHEDLGIIYVIQRDMHNSGTHVFNTICDGDVFSDASDKLEEHISDLLVL